ncbi:hypothetical protein BBP40_007960 [Aspergillus hancockii]|nr:hypothetical protein BBP40_007960 [Aspergillus hancockii]
MDSKSQPRAHHLLGNNNTTTTTTTTQSKLTSSPSLAFSPQPQNPICLAPTKQQPIPPHHPTHQPPDSQYYHQVQQGQQVQHQQFPESGTGGPQQQQSESYPHQVSGSGGPTATAPFLRDFSLVAEAAKRAQMSVVMRDLEAVTL